MTISTSLNNHINDNNNSSNDNSTNTNDNNMNINNNDINSSVDLVHVMGYSPDATQPILLLMWCPVCASSV